MFDIKSVAFWVVAPRILVACQHFEGTHCPRNFGWQPKHNAAQQLKNHRLSTFTSS
jgi:hypothetical protein